MEILKNSALLLLDSTVFSPIFIAAVSGILIFERIFPVNPNQRTFSIGFIQDSIWFVFAILFQGSVVTAYAEGLKSFYSQHLSFMNAHSVMNQVPLIIRFSLAVFLSDFFAWFQHWLKHRVPWFWQIHAVHHSQTELNLFTDLRFHFMEYLISKPIVLFPLIALGIETPTILLYTVFATWQTRFYHANIRMNFGPLRYIFVTPQSHRIHHSHDFKHQDKNFGVMFSFWDRLFRTQYSACSEYPETGIRDAAFPLENSGRPVSVLMTLIRQTAYPLISIAKSLKRRV
jgi:sterol desaturase/sphingolipid hydroxylase (fatty acid hydroxylase superfamily)